MQTDIPKIIYTSFVGTLYLFSFTSKFMHINIHLYNWALLAANEDDVNAEHTVCFLLLLLNIGSKGN